VKPQFSIVLHSPLVSGLIVRSFDGAEQGQDSADSGADETA
jgi:hypothetical protein